MTESEFADFIARVPLGTRVKGKTIDMVISREMGDLNINELEGVIVRHGFEFERSPRSRHGKGTTWIDALVVTFFDNPHEWDIRPEYLLYWINDSWQTHETILGTTAN